MKKIFLLLLALLLLASCAPRVYSIKYDATYFKGKNCQDAYEIFKNEGFNNVELVEDENVNKIMFWLKNGDVTEVSIAGKTDFKNGDVVKVSDKVVIRYINKK